MSTTAQEGQGFSANLKVAKKKDVVVVGSGPGGCIAALSARRNGADVLLLERESYLGGMMTGGGIGGIGINGYTAAVEGNPIVVKGISLELLKRLQAPRGGGRTPQPCQKTGRRLPGSPGSRQQTGTRWKRREEKEEPYASAWPQAA